MFQSAGADLLAQATGLTLLEQDFESALAAIPSGYGEGMHEGLRYGVTVRKPGDGRRTSLFARALAGGDVVSFNLYRPRSGEDSLRPCKMPAEKVVALPGPKVFLVILLIDDSRWQTWFASVAFFSFRSEKCSFVAAYISR